MDDEHRRPALPSRSMIEAASWHVAAELVRKAPSALTVAELHPGGGQYDCLTVIRLFEVRHDLCLLRQAARISCTEAAESDIMTILR